MPCHNPKYFCNAVQNALMQLLWLSLVSLHLELFCTDCFGHQACVLAVHGQNFAHHRHGAACKSALALIARHVCAGSSSVCNTGTTNMSVVPALHFCPEQSWMFYLFLLLLSTGYSVLRDSYLLCKKLCTSCSTGCSWYLC